MGLTEPAWPETCRWLGDTVRRQRETEGGGREMGEGRTSPGWREKEKKGKTSANIRQKGRENQSR